MATPIRKTHFLIALIAAALNGLKREVFGSPLQASLPVFTNLGAVPAPAALHASIPSGAFDVSTAFSAMPLPRRSVQAVYGVGTVPHTLEITGTHPLYGNPQVVNLAITGPGTFDSVKGFGSITRVRALTAPGGAGIVSGGALQLNTGLGICVPAPGGLGGSPVLAANGVAEDPAASDQDTATITPTTPADGAVVFTVQSSGGIQGGPAFVHLDQSERTVTAPVASDLPTSIALVKDLLGVYAFHRTDTLAHLAADSTNTVASVPADVVDLATAQTAINQLKAAFNNHLNQMGVHAMGDGSRMLTSPDASGQPSLNTLANEARTKLNAHMAAGATTPSWRLADL